MAYTQADLDSVEAAIRSLIAGTRTVSLSMGDKSITYDRSDLKTLVTLRDSMKYEVGMAAGTYVPRTYARQGGRCK